MMQVQRFIPYVDTHTAGEPTRIILAGFPRPRGRTMEERRSWLSVHADALRRFVLQEPRGHSDMFAALLSDPIDPGCDAGVFFLQSGGFLGMCGHGTIGVATVMVALGWVTADHLTLETPSGQVRCRIHGTPGTPSAVSVENVPAFYLEEREVDGVHVALSYGGNLFGLVDVADVGERIALESIEPLIAVASRFRDRLNAGGPWVHPETAKSMSVELIEFYDHANPPRNVVVFGDRQVDRSPCGTGTSAKMAYLHAAGRLPVGEPYPYRSVLGTEFVGRILREVKVGGCAGIVPEITGSAHIVGMGNLILADGDPFPEGFALRTAERDRPAIF